MATKNIEEFFNNTLLKISTGGVFFILCTDAFFYPEDILSISIDVIVLLSSCVSFLIRKKHQTISVLVITCITLAAMFFQCIKVPMNTTTSLSVILVVGFIFSIMLKGPLLITMHVVTFLLVHSIFVIQYVNPQLRFLPEVEEAITVAFTYSILYFILTYSAAVLKQAYNKLYSNLASLNVELEKTVADRTLKIQQQNEALFKYSYSNAHQLRGPVARLLGLAQLSRIDAEVAPREIIRQMERQAEEIDTVITQINRDLEANHFSQPMEVVKS